MLCNLIVFIASGIFLMVRLMMTKYVNKFCWFTELWTGVVAHYSVIQHSGNDCFVDGLTRVTF